MTSGALRRSLVLAASAAAVYAAVVLVAGWEIGGRPAGWYEGKAPVMPLIVAGSLCELLALAGLYFALRAMASRAELPRRWVLAAVCFPVLVNASLIIAALTPSGLVIAYAIAHWRQSTGL
ncbi:MAG TPA: hypothetical protein VIN61_04220 [Gammaproteobacteria bacterium]